MKIVCMIGTPLYLHYFVNEIAKHHELALVIRENAQTISNILKKISSKGLIHSAGLIFNRFRNQKRHQTDINEILGRESGQLLDLFPLFTASDINSEDVRQKLQEIKPDLVLVHGTSLIKKKTIAGIPLALNLHWGLSPYYKGSYCTQWALINSDPFNIGFTIHRISSKIDGGDILTQGRIAVTSSDTANRINMRLTKQGTQEMCFIINRLKNNETPEFTKQDDSKSNLYLVKYWTKEKQNALDAIENSASINAMLISPSRQALPIVKW